MKVQDRNCYLWLTLLCYLIPLAALGAVLLLGAPMTNALVFAAILVCLSIHLSLMILMNRTGHVYSAVQDPEGFAAGRHLHLPAERSRDMGPSS